VVLLDGRAIESLGVVPPFYHFSVLRVSVDTRLLFAGSCFEVRRGRSRVEIDIFFPDSLSERSPPCVEGDTFEVIEESF